MNRGATLVISHMDQPMGKITLLRTNDTVSMITYGRNAKAYLPRRRVFGLELGSPFNIRSTLIRTNHQLSEVSPNAYSSSSLP